MDLTRSSLKLFLANIIGSAIVFLGITYFARELGAAEIGAFFLFEALLGILAIPADFGLSGALEKRISEGKDQGLFLSSALLIKIAPIFLIVSGILFFAPLINSYVGADIAILLAISVILQDGARVSLFVLKGELRVGETALLNVIRQITWVAIGALFVSQGFGVHGVIFGFITGLTVMLLLGWYKRSTSFGRPSKKHAISLVEYGKFNVVSSVGGYFYSWMDVAIIGLFLSQAEVGAYEVAWRVTSLVAMLSIAISDTIFPQLSQWDAMGSKTQIETVIRDAITPALMFVIPSFFGVLVFSREILGLVFGPEFTIASLVLIVLMGEKLFQSVHKILGRALQGINHPDLSAYSTIVTVGLNLILNLVLIPWLGIVGAAIATSFAFIVNTALHGYFVSKYLSIDFPLLEIGWLLLSSFLMTMFLIAVRRSIHIITLPLLLGSIVSGAVVYGMIALLFPSFRRRIKQMVQ